MGRLLAILLSGSLVGAAWAGSGPSPVLDGVELSLHAGLLALKVASARPDLHTVLKGLTLSTRVPVDAGLREAPVRAFCQAFLEDATIRVASLEKAGAIPSRDVELRCQAGRVTISGAALSRWLIRGKLALVPDQPVLAFEPDTVRIGLLKLPMDAVFRALAENPRPGMRLARPFVYLDLPAGRP